MCWECSGATIRATILAVKSKGTLAKAPDASFSLTVSPDLVGKAPVVDPGILLVDTSYGKEIDALSIDALSSPLREDAKRLLATPRGEWSATDLAIYKTLTGAGGTPSEGCGGLPEGEILLDWFSRKAFVCNPSLDELEAGVRKTFLADHPDNAYDVLRKHYFGVV